MQNLLGTTQSRLAQSLSPTHGLFHKVINIGGGGANTLHSLDKSPKNTLYSYKSVKPAKQLFHALIARGFNESPNQSKLSVIARALPKAIHKIKIFVSFGFSQKVESSYPLDSNPQSKTKFHYLANTRNIRLRERVL